MERDMTYMEEVDVLAAHLAVADRLAEAESEAKLLRETAVSEHKLLKNMFCNSFSFQSNQNHFVHIQFKKK